MNQIVTSSPLLFLDAKQFYRKVEMIFREVNTFGSQELFAHSFLSRFHHHLSVSMGIQAVHLYDSTGLVCSWGEFVSDLTEELDSIRNHGVEFPWTGPLHGRVAAALPLYEDSSLMAVFLLDSFEGVAPEPASILAASSVFSSLHYAIIQNLRRLELQDVFEQARLIQMSLLPGTPPSFGEFQIAAVTIPARSVGGDIYDFHTINPQTLAFALGDASGHGFPAALQARDVITGLRMGWDPEMDLLRTIEKLNGVIHRSGLGSRFVSLVAGLLDLDGELRYINAGHPPPILMNHSGFHELNSAGLILGPFPWTRYREERATLPPGSMLLVYSDGVLEHTNNEGIEFGKTRLKQWMDEWRRGPAEMAVSHLFQQLREFSNGRPFQDDASILLIHRLD